eukprot:SAG31_NODE_1391_length_8535_cov_11.998696_12_plen_132_part_00
MYAPRARRAVLNLHVATTVINLVPTHVSYVETVLHTSGGPDRPGFDSNLLNLVLGDNRPSRTHVVVLDSNKFSTSTAFAKVQQHGPWQHKFTAVSRSVSGSGRGPYLACVYLNLATRRKSGTKYKYQLCKM